MKHVILAALLAVGSSALAYTVDYGPGAYKKTVRVCGYGRHSSSLNDCKMMTYNYFAPRVEKICKRSGKNEDGSIVKCYNRLTTGNYGTKKFKDAAESRAFFREMTRGGGESRNRP